MIRSRLYRAAAFSGAGALLMETVWIRHFALLIGANTPSVSTVLAVYMAGLAVGSILGPRLAAETESRRSRYVTVEVAIALTGVALTGLLQWLNGSLRPVPAAAPLALASMLGVTLLMGLTTPLLVGLLPPRKGGLAQPVGWLYATNTGGAAAGALIGGFVLVEHLGLLGTALAAAAANLIAAHLAIRADTSEVVEPEPPPPLELRRLPWVLAGVAFASSLFGMAMEVLLSRGLVMILSSHTYALALLLTGLLLGLSIGGLLPAHCPALSRRPTRTLGLCLVGLAALAALAPHVIVALRGHEPTMLTWVGSQWWRFLAVNALAVATLTVPLGVILGLVPPLAVLGFSRERLSVTSGVGWIGLLSGLGSILGPPCAAFVLLPLLGLGPSFTVLSAAIGVAGVVLTTRSGARGAGLVAGAALLLLVALTPRQMVALMTDPGDRLVLSLDSSFGSAMVVESTEGIRFLVTNLGGAVGDDSPTHVMMQRRQYLLPAMLAARRERVVEIGLGTGISISPATADPTVARLTALEISPAVAAAARVFAEPNLAVLDHPKVELVVDDGRAWLRRQDRSVDLILVELFNSEETGISALYSQQFYHLCASRLRPGGLLAQALSLAELPGDELRAVLSSMTRAFPTVQLWLMYPNVLIATGSDAPPSAIGPRVETALADPRLGPLMRRAGLRSSADVVGRFLLDVGASGLVDGVAPVDDNHPAFECRVPRRLMFIGRNFHEIASTCATIQRHLQAPPPSLAPDLSPAALRRLALRRPYLSALAARTAGRREEAARLVAEILEADPDDVDALILTRDLELHHGTSAGSVAAESPPP